MLGALSLPCRGSLPSPPSAVYDPCGKAFERARITLAFTRVRAGTTVTPGRNPDAIRTRVPLSYFWRRGTVTSAVTVAIRFKINASGERVAAVDSVQDVEKAIDTLGCPIIALAPIAEI